MNRSSKLKKIELAYSLWELLFLKLDIDKLKIHDPNINIKEVDGKKNIDAILAFREEHFPTSEIKEPPMEQKEFSLNDIPISPSLVFLPLRIEIDNIGIENISFDYKKIENGKKVINLSQENLSLEISFSWFLDNSKLFIRLGNLDNQKFNFNIQNKTNEINLSANADIYLSSDNFKDIKYKATIKKLDISSDFAELNDLEINNEFSISLYDDLKGMNLNYLKFNDGNIFKLNIDGSVELPDGDFEKIRLDVSKQFQINLDELVKVGRLFIPNLDGGGKVDLEKFKIDGLVDLSKFDSIENIIPPFIALNLFPDHQN